MCQVLGPEARYPWLQEAHAQLTDNHSSLRYQRGPGIGVEAKHPGRMRQHLSGLVEEQALSWTLKRLVKLRQAVVGEGASDGTM